MSQWTSAAEESLKHLLVTCFRQIAIDEQKTIIYDECQCASFCKFANFYVYFIADCRLVYFTCEDGLIQVKQLVNLK